MAWDQWYGDATTWYTNTDAQTAVREYASREDMDHNVAQAAAFGWRVTAMSEQSQRAGCMRFLVLGIFALIFKPKSKMLVNFARHADAPSAANPADGSPWISNRSM